MQFLQPLALYGLFALAIPIMVHLFQLRKFRPEPFTNVVLLKKLIKTSRKSSTLKKWISLITRLLIIASIVLAFSQPYFPNSDQSLQKKQISIFLDNSYSMSLDGENTTLFKEAKEELLEVLPESESYNFATHSESYRNIRAEDLKSLIYDIDFTIRPLNLKSILTKTESLFNSTLLDTKNEIIVLSDFQQLGKSDNLDLSKDYNYHFVKYTAQDQINFSIDTAFVESSGDENTLKFKVSSSANISQSVPISIYNEDNLLGKFSLVFNDESQKLSSFSLNNENILKGKLTVEDKGLKFDNELFFSIEKPDPINVLVISEEQTTYLDNLFNKERFNYQQKLLRNLEYEDINLADVVILNEIKQLPSPLRVAVENYTESSKVLCIIPGNEIELSNYNSLFNTLNLNTYKPLTNNALRLTTINFNHPIFEGVFTESVENFDYPTFETYYQSTYSEKALSFSNGMPFLESKGNIFRFNAPITENSNFKQSPLVVLSFFNIALQVQNKQQLYLENGDDFRLKMSDELNQDEVLNISNKDFSFIPRQRIFGREVELSFKEYPETAGHYLVQKQNKDTLSILAFNPNRKESKLEYLNLTTFDNVKTYSNFKNYTENFYDTYNIKSLWKWFIGLALIFMIIELLLLRFIK